jgi:hypothetical protein
LVLSEPLVVSLEDFAYLEDMLGKRPKGVEDVAAYLTSVFKRSKVALSLFQHIDLTGRVLWRAVTRGETSVLSPTVKAWLGNAAPPSIRRKLQQALLDDPIIKEGLEEGLGLYGGRDIWRRELADALNPDLVLRAPILGEVKVIPRQARQAANAAYQYVAGGLFDVAVPEYNAFMYKSIRAELVKKYPQLTSRQVSAMAAEHTNIFMSNIPEWLSVVKPRIRQLGRGTFFSVNEMEAWFRVPSRAMTSKNKLLYLKQWPGFVLGTLAVAETINVAITGHLMEPKQYQPITLQDGKPAFNPTFLRPQIDGDGLLGKVLGVTGPAGRHIYLDLLGQADTPFRVMSPVFFTMTRLAPQWSTGYQLIKGERYFGGDKLTNWKDMVKFTAENLFEPIPFTSMTGKEGKRIGKGGSTLQAIGFNVSAEKLADLRNRTAEGDTQFGKPYDKLDRQGRLDYKTKYPEHFAASEDMPEGTPAQRSVELSEEKVGHIKEIGDQFNIDHDGQAYIDARSQILTDAATRQDEINQDSDYKPKTDQDKAVQEWNQMIVDAKAKAPGGVLNGMAFGELERQAQQTLGTQKWALVEQSRMASADPVEKEYLADRSALENYWQIEDDLWKKLVVDNAKALPKLRAFPTYRDYLADAQSRAEAKNLSPAYAYTDPVAKEFEKRATAYSQSYLLHNPEVDALRVIWGYAQGVHSKPAYDIYYKRTGLRPRVIVPD